MLSFAFAPNTVSISSKRIVAPSWAPVDHEAGEPADLFAVTDRPVLEALHLYREVVEVGAQEVTSTFSPR